MNMMTSISSGNNAVTPIDMTSYHGLYRTIERLNCRNEKQALRIIRLAWERGTSMSDLDLVKQKKYLAARDGRCAEGATQFRVYQNHLWIFSPDPDPVLITVYPVPKDFSKRGHYIGKQKIRDFKQYERTKRFECDLEYAV